MKSILLWAALLCLPASLFAQTTAINDTIYGADGATWNGSILVSWPAFTMPSGRAIAAGKRYVTVTNGVLSVSLYPLDGVSPSGVVYTAVYTTTSAPSRGETWSETWTVPASPAVVTLRAVRLSSTLVIYLSQLDSGGAADGNCLKWSASLGKYAPATSCGGSGGLSPSSTWAQYEAGTGGTGTVTATSTWAQIEAM